MRLLHTADWHLGRQLHNVSLIEDQAHVLDQLVRLAEERRVDAVVVAGDIYDRAVPPADAVNLLGNVLQRLVLGAGIPVVMIAGNHDSAARLGFGARMLAASGLHLFGALHAGLAPVWLEDAHGPVAICPIPYADPAEVRLHLDDPSLNSHDSATRALSAAIGAALPAGARSVAVAHCWVAGGSASESERPLTVGGTGEVASDCFAEFHFTCLGHLHRPQSVEERVHYAGSLLKYSASEADHRKSVSLVTIDRSGAAEVERIALTPRRDLRIIEGPLAQLLQGPVAGRSAEDYLVVRLTDRQAILDAIGQLRDVYPNVLHLERPGLQTGAVADRSAGDHLRRSELELFRDFHQQVAGHELIPGGEAALLEVVAKLRSADREGGAA